MTAPETAAAPPMLAARVPAMQYETAEARRTERDLAAAVRSGGFLLHYQPRLRLATAQPVGAEALVRWPHRRRGLVSASSFIPLAERSGHIAGIGAWVLRTACEDARHWPGDRIVSVNVSVQQIADGSLLPQLADALEESGLPPEQLELELTEALVLDTGLDTLLTLSAIRDLGVGIALDDFGVGQAGLSMLKRLPLTAMKLDRSLLRELPGCPEDATIARAVIETGRVLGLTVVAEGVESAEQFAFLRDAGCDEGQGYWLGRPVPADELRLDS
jgi:EAL domain-containing protein (putative c-di-GMP-specific phosphodiesterase class I)